MSNLEVFNCEQGTEEWFAARLGIATASEFDTVMAKGKGGGPSKTRKDYMLKLIGERMTGTMMENFTSSHTERGKRMEPEARDAYAVRTDTWPEPVGFIRRGRAGASPDSLINDDGLLEIKTKLSHLQLEALIEDRLPPQHKAQVQGQLWIAGREWNDFVSYWPGMPLLVVRVHRDEAYIAQIAKAVGEFNAEMDELIKTLSLKFGPSWFLTKPKAPSRVDVNSEFDNVEG